MSIKGIYGVENYSARKSNTPIFISNNLRKRIELRLQVNEFYTMFRSIEFRPTAYFSCSSHSLRTKQRTQRSKVSVMRFENVLIFNPPASTPVFAVHCTTAQKSAANIS